MTRFPELCRAVDI